MFRDCQLGRSVAIGIATYFLFSKFNQDMSIKVQHPLVDIINKNEINRDMTL